MLAALRRAGGPGPAAHRARRAGRRRPAPAGAAGRGVRRRGRLPARRRRRRSRAPTSTSPATCATTRPRSSSRRTARPWSTSRTGRRSGPGCRCWRQRLRAGVGRYGGDPGQHAVHRPVDLPPPLSTTPEEHPLKADPAAQLRLLDLQALDARADQLRHQRRSLPELAEITALQASRDLELVDQRRDAQIVVDDLEVEQAQGRRRRRGRQDPAHPRPGPDGPRPGTNPKDLERMQGELQSLQRRITCLEDEELEVMVRLEEAQGTLDDLTGQHRGGRRPPRRAAGQPRREGRHDRPATSTPRWPSGSRRWSACPRTCSPSTRSSARPRAASVRPSCARGRCGGCRLALDNAELSAIRASPPDARRALRGVLADPGAHRRVRPVSSAPRARRGRGRRRLARQPRPRGVRRGAQGRRRPARCSPRTAPAHRRASNNVAEYSRPDRRAPARRRARPRRGGRGADGLQARRRADVGALEDQAPRHEPAGRRGRGAGAGRHDVHLGAARAERARRPARQRGPRRHARRRRRSPSSSPTRCRRPCRTGRGLGGGPAPAGRGWSPAAGTATTLLLVRHGVTAPHRGKRFSGGLGGVQPRRSATRAATRCARPRSGWRRSPSRIDAVVASPVRRTRESAEILGRGAGPRGRRWSRASPRWSSASGTGSPSPRSPSATRPVSTPGSARSTSRPRAGSPSASCRSGCSPASSGCWRPTTAGPSSWSAT